MNALLLAPLALATLLLPGSSRLEPSADERAPRAGAWRAWLDSPGGELPFGLELVREGDERNDEAGGAWRATIANGAERIALDTVRVADGRVHLALEGYAAALDARVGEDGTRLDGEWTRASPGGATSRLAFHATLWQGAGAAPRFAPGGAQPTVALDGRWRARFESSADDAVALLEQEADGTLAGTFLTTTGDYRYLAGVVEGRRLRLSAFDGAHAFLFDATLGPDDALAGRFWSRESWQESWRAVRDAQATLADAWRQVEPREGFPLSLARYPDVRDASGERLRSLAEPALSGRPAVIEVFGTWCPNCHDAGTWLAALRERLGPQRLALVGLAFEYDADWTIDRERVLRYASRHGFDASLDLLLLGGLADKARASEALPFLRELKAFPTLVLVDRRGTVRAVYTGFSGPATGAAHERETAELERRIRALVDEPAPSDERASEADATALALLASDVWREEPSEALWSFVVEGASASGAYTLDPPRSFGGPPDGGEGAGEGETADEAEHGGADDEPQAASPAALVEHGRWRLVGDTLLLTRADGATQAFALDARAGVLLDPADAGRRLHPAARPRVAVLDGRALDTAEELARALAGESALARREALYHLALERAAAARLPPEFRPEPHPRDALELPLASLLADPDPLVRASAAWAAGALADASAREALRQALTDGYAPLRREAARALERLGPDEVDAAALAALMADLDPSVRAAARAALGSRER